MASNYTENYQLNQWEPTDKVLREEFNADNAKVDAALAACPKIISGTYTGTGETTAACAVGAKPRLLLLGHGSTFATGVVRGVIAAENGLWFRICYGSSYPSMAYVTNSPVTFTEDGFTVDCSVLKTTDYNDLNLKNTVYSWLALC